MKAKNVLIVFAILAMAVMFTACPDVVGPDNPPQYKPYDLKITYKRTVINGSDIEGVWLSLRFATVYGDGGTLKFSTDDNTLIKVDELTFTAFAQAVPSNDYKDAKKHYIWCVDPKRYDGSNASSLVVGTDFYLEGPKNTIKLTHIVTNVFHSYGGQMAEFVLIIDGTLIDE